MTLVSRLFFLNALLVPLAFSLPSAAEEKNPSSKESFVGRIDITIHCYFYSNSPECQDVNDDATGTEGNVSDGEPSVDSDSDRSPDNVNTDNDDTFSTSNEPSDEITPANTYDLLKELLSYEPQADENQYDDMEMYHKYWEKRKAARKQLCSMCLAVISRQDVLQVDNSELLEPLQGPSGAVNHRTSDNIPLMLRPFEAKIFKSIKDKFEHAKASKGLDMDKPVSIEEGFELCSGITRELLLDRAIQNRKQAQGEMNKKGARNAVKKYKFYHRFISNMESDPQYLMCDSIDMPRITWLNTIFQDAISRELNA